MPLDDVALRGRTNGPGVSQPTPPQPTGYQQALNYYTGQYQPQLATLDLQGTIDQNHLGQFYAQNQLAQSQAGQNGSFANQDYGLGMENIGNQRAGIGIDTNYWQQMLASNGTLANLSNQLLGLNTQDITNQAQAATRNQTSQAVANGALQAKNTVSNLADIITQRDLGIGKAQNQNQTMLTNLNQQDYRYQRAIDMNANQLKGLDITAKQLGLSRDKALASINQGLARLNLDNTIGAQDLFDAMQSNDYQRQQIADQIIREATQGYSAGYFGNPSSPGSYSGTPQGTSSTRPPNTSLTKSSSKLPNMQLGGQFGG